MKRILFCLTILSLLAVDANAQKFSLFSRAKPDSSQQALELTDKAGPWLIMCASFSGEEGRQQAYRLARELREEYRLDAYIYSHHFDFANEVSSKALGWEVQDLGDDHELVPKQMKPAGEARFEEIAVLVGDFPSIEDAKAQRALEQIKTLKPETMANYDKEAAVNDSTLAGSRLRAWRDFVTERKSDPDEQMKGPFKAAFLIPNPTMPEEYFEARKTDTAVLKWNKDPGLEYSLLKNKGKYSVKIASFKGESTWETNEIEKIQQEDSWLRNSRKSRTESKLDKAYKKAQILTKYLRNEGIEAYEFHDRHESYVCVGSFDWLRETDAGGRERNNPDMVAAIKKFKGRMVALQGRPNAMATYQLPSKLAKAGIACDLQPVPVLVPVDSTRTASRLFGRR